MTRARTARRVLSVAAIACLAALAPLPLRAHPLAPALLELRERAEGLVEVRWKTSLYRARDVELRPVLPAGCRARAAPSVVQTRTSRTERWAVDCGGVSLVGQRVGVQGLAENRIDALVRVELRDGRLLRGVIGPRDPEYEIPAAARPLDVVRAYGAMGAGHMLGGPDHLLFVFGLLLLCSSLRTLLVTLTAFTLGHSVTLSLAALGIVRFPPRPLEVLIALSIFTLAVQLVREEPRSSHRHRSPWILAAGFGLLHGLALAGALAQAGLPAGEIPLALLSFNLGVELGQVVFVGAVTGTGALLAGPLARLPAWSRRVPVYAMGSLAAFWCFERAAVLLP